MDNISTLDAHDFSTILADILFIAPYLNMTRLNDNLSAKSLTISNIQQIYQSLENHIVFLTKESNPIDAIIELCLNICYIYKFASLETASSVLVSNSIYEPLKVFNGKEFQESIKNLLKISWLYNVSTVNTPKQFKDIVEKFSSEDKTRELLKKFTKDKFDFVSQYSTLCFPYGKIPKNRINNYPLCLYDALSTHPYLITHTSKKRASLHIDSFYDLCITFGLLTNRKKNNPLFSLYNKEISTNYQRSFNFQSYLSKYFPLNETESITTDYQFHIFNNYLIERLTYANLLNISFKPNYPTEIFSTARLLSLYPLLNFRINLFNSILDNYTTASHSYLSLFLQTISHQIFFYLPLLNTIFHLSMLIAKKHLPYSANKNMDFLKNSQDYSSYIKLFNLQETLFFNKKQAPLHPIPNFQSSIHPLKQIYINRHHAIHHTLQTTLYKIESMNFLEDAFRFKQTINSIPFTEFVFDKYGLNHISQMTNLIPSEDIF